MTMTQTEAREWVHTREDDEIDHDDLEAAFRALFGRAPDRLDREEGLWSHVCSAAAAVG